MLANGLKISQLDLGMRMRGGCVERWSLFLNIIHLLHCLLRIWWLYIQKACSLVAASELKGEFRSTACDCWNVRIYNCHAFYVQIRKDTISMQNKKITKSSFQNPNSEFKKMNTKFKYEKTYFKT